MGTTVWIIPKNCNTYNIKTMITKIFNKLLMAMGSGINMVTNHNTSPKTIMLANKFSKSCINILICDHFIIIAFILQKFGYLY